MKNIYYAIGDIHGCSQHLKAMLKLIDEHINRQDDDVIGNIVFLGDYVDRGPDSKGVIDIIRAPSTNPRLNKIALKGNHEAMMNDHMILWITNGGRETLHSFNDNIPEDVLEWADNLPLMHVTKNIIFVHAGLNPQRTIEEQTETDLLWIRWPFLKSEENPWGKTIVHGHTPVATLKTDSWKINVDTGAVFYGILSCVVLNEAGKMIDTIQVSDITLSFILDSEGN